MPGTEAWGVTEVIVRYYAGKDQWEISLDPGRIDVLVFNWERFRRINEVVGGPMPASHHAMPDGASADGARTPEQMAELMGLNGPPRRIGERASGTSGDPICFHRTECDWFCTYPNHDHDT